MLGPVEVLGPDRTPVALGGAKPRELLGLLTMRPNRPVPSEQLVEELWEGDAPPSAAAALRVHVARIRQALEPERGQNAPSSRLPAGPHGYLLRVEPDELDAERFERLVALGRDANADGDPRSAAAQLDDALALWRGRPYGDIAHLSAIAAEVARLTELRIHAIEELADARLARSEHALVVDLLAAAVEEFPLREQVTARLMRALYRCGRQADALAAYAALRRRLDDELGVEPCSELRRLEEDVLLQRPTLDAPSATEGQRASNVSTSVIRFVGRRQEMTSLLQAHADVTGGERRLVLVSGDAGIGKTTLIEEFARRVAGRQTTVFTGRCSHGPQPDYAPLAEILAGVVGGVGARERAELAYEIGLLVPGLGTGPQLPGDTAGDTAGDEAESERFRMFEAVAGTLARVAPRPLVMVIEDLHWADRPTLTMLRHVLRHPALDRTLVIATYREDEVSGERADLIARLAPPNAVHALHLDGFDHNEVRALIRATATPEVMHHLVDLAPAVRDVTGGNPFFTRELLREFDDDPSQLRDADDIKRVLGAIAPSGVHMLIDRRVADLSDRGRTVLHAAAIVERDICVRILATSCGMPLDATLDAVEESLAARLLVEDPFAPDRFAFAHAVVRNVVYAGIEASRRPLLHHQVAVALEAVAEEQFPGLDARLAHHYGEAACVGDSAKAAHYARRAAEDALDRFAFAEGASWYSRAIEFEVASGTPPNALGWLHFALGRAHEGNREPETARQAYLLAAGAARATNDAALLADVAIAFAGPWASGFDSQQVARALLDEALDVNGTSDRHRRVQLLNGLAAALYYVDPDREGSVVDEALSLAGTLDDAAALAAARLSQHRWLTHRPAARCERLTLALEALDASRAIAGGHMHLRVYRELLSDFLENARFTDFDAGLDDYECMAGRVCSPRDIYWAAVLRATQATVRGNLTSAEQFARGAELRGRDLPQGAAGAHLLQRFVIRFQQGRLAEIAAVLREAAQAGSSYRAGLGLAALASAEAGRPADGADIAWRALGPDGQRLRRDVFWLGAVALFAGAASAACDLELAALLEGLLGECADHIVVFGVGGAVLGSGHHWLGQLAAARGNNECAVAHLEQAICVSEQIGSPYWRAQAQLDLAAARSASGRATRASRALRDAAVATAAQRGFGRVLRRAESLAF